MSEVPITILPHTSMDLQVRFASAPLAHSSIPLMTHFPHFALLLSMITCIVSSISMFSPSIGTKPVAQVVVRDQFLGGAVAPGGSRAVHSGERGCYRSNRKNYRIDRIELRKKIKFRAWDAPGASQVQGASQAVNAFRAWDAPGASQV